MTAPGSAPRDNPFWTYALALYERPGVAPACLGLQDRLGLDVNLLLFCCWAGSRGRALAVDEIESLIRLTRPWRDQVVRPLRGARRWLKSQDRGPAAQALRDDIKSGELSAEAIQQALMHEALPVGEGAASADSAAANLRVYLKAEGAAVRDADREVLATLLRAAVPGFTAEQAVQALRG